MDSRGTTSPSPAARASPLPDASVWHPTPTEAAAFARWFQHVDTQNRGLITGAEAVPFFTLSGLPASTLGEIWELADQERRGSLGPAAFGVALKLIALAQAGETPTRTALPKPVPLPLFEGADAPRPATPPPSSSAISPPPATTAVAGLGTPTDYLSDAERAKYTRLFHSCQPAHGLLDGDRARQVLLKSKLPVDTLGRIWTLADTRRRGALDLADFTIAMYYVQRIMEGRMATPPAEVPSALLTSAREGRSVPASPALATPAATLAANSWDVTPATQTRADRYFATLDPTHRGYVAGDEAVPFFLKSRLPEADLATIWDLADHNKSGRLNREEFAVAVHLISAAQAGTPPPARLPPSLIPPGHREFARARSPAKPRSASQAGSRPLSPLDMLDPFGPRGASPRPLSPEPFEAGPTNNTSSPAGQLAAMQALLARKHTRASELLTARAALDGKGTALNSQLSDLTTQLEQIQARVAAEERALRDLEADLQTRNDRLPVLRTQIAEAEARHGELREAYAAKKRALDAAEAEHGSFQQRLQAALSEVQKAQGDAQRLEAQAQADAERAAIGARQLAQVETERDALRARLAVAVQQAEERRTAAEALATRRAAAEQEAAELARAVAAKELEAGATDPATSAEAGEGEPPKDKEESSTSVEPAAAVQNEVMEPADAHNDSLHEAGRVSEDAAVDDTRAAEVPAASQLEAGPTFAAFDAAFDVPDSPPPATSAQEGSERSFHSAAATAWPETTAAAPVEPDHPFAIPTSGEAANTTVPFTAAFEDHFDPHPPATVSEGDVVIPVPALTTNGDDFDALFAGMEINPPSQAAPAPPTSEPGAKGSAAVADDEDDDAEFHVALDPHFADTAPPPAAGAPDFGADFDTAFGLATSSDSPSAAHHPDILPAGTPAEDPVAAFEHRFPDVTDLDPFAQGRRGLDSTAPPPAAAKSPTNDGDLAGLFDETPATTDPEQVEADARLARELAREEEQAAAPSRPTSRKKKDGGRSAPAERPVSEHPLSPKKSRFAPSRFNVFAKNRLSFAPLMKSGSNGGGNGKSTAATNVDDAATGSPYPRPRPVPSSTGARPKSAAVPLSTFAFTPEDFDHAHLSPYPKAAPESATPAATVVPNRTRSAKAAVPDTDEVRTLVGMGFPRDRVIEALEVNDFDLQRATDYLLSF
ncbi:hypothetical protein IWQ60_002386 [Tieghemiomyces parasiticus]|uniref:Uncharacterized protein n=1 Tax=Tieghemiomyces parasiticus TaxID=78921 RepID=A0A9W8AJ52_9FUNG|nr:hypothetical protein IWQ60_002386 [Tieghemiomyces parasiticus]